MTIEQLNGPHWNPVAKNAWQIAYFILTEKMLKLENYDHNANLDLKKQKTQKQNKGEDEYDELDVPYEEDEDEHNEPD